MRPIVALVGRPNVGKSTLYNFLTQTNDALVADYAGVTRDRKYGICRRYGADFILIDTGGVFQDKERLNLEVFEQTRQAIEQADKVFLLVDANDGLTPDDRYIAQWLRKLGIEFVLLINKIDGHNEQVVSSEFFELGAPDVFGIAARRGRGIRSLLNELNLSHEEEQNQIADDEEYLPNVAIVGRPNVGKSTLTNSLLNSERMIVSDISGTTRDAVSEVCELYGTKIRLTDTAGIRRKSKTHHMIEKFSIVQALQAIADADVVVLLVDSTQGLTDQESSLIEIILREGCALVIAMNKSDIADHDHRQQMQYAFQTKLQYIPFVERIPVSAKKRIGLKKLSQAIDRAYRSASVSVNTAEVNKLLEGALAAHQPPMVRGRRIKIRYAHQIAEHPPTIVLHGTQTERLPDAYVRYLEGYYRKALKLVGTPIRFYLRSADNPFEGKQNKLTPRQQRKRDRMLKRRSKKH